MHDSMYGTFEKCATVPYPLANNIFKKSKVRLRCILPTLGILKILYSVLQCFHHQKSRPTTISSMKWLFQSVHPSNILHTALWVVATWKTYLPWTAVNRTGALLVEDKTFCHDKCPSLKWPPLYNNSFYLYRSKVVKWREHCICFCCS